MVLETINEYDDIDRKALVLIQIRYRESEVLSVRELREVLIGSGWIQTKEWRVTRLIPR